VAAVLVHIDLDDNQRPARASLTALAAGRHVASSWGATLYAAVLVHDPEHPSLTSTIDEVLATTMPNLPKLGEIEDALARGGADKVVVAVSRSPVEPLWASVGNAWQGVIDHLRPRLVLFGADAPSAAELGPRTAARLGGRLLLRARASGIDDVELRDRDGGYARASDGGAAVALIGRAAKTIAIHDADVDVVVLAVPGVADVRLELVATQAAKPAQSAGTLIAIGDDVAGDEAVIANAKTLASLIDAQIVGGNASVRAGAIAKDGVVERNTPLAPELLVAIGDAQLDVGGATSVVKIGATPANRVTNVDGALPGAADVGLAALVKNLEQR
jgi:hypothetical protein